MQIKKVIAGIGIGAFISAGGFMACDYAFGKKEAVNYVYCGLDSMINSFDKNEITEVTVALYAEHTLAPKEIMNSMQGFDMAAEEYMNQFGIKLNVIEYSLIALPDRADTSYMKEIGNQNADINIFFTDDMPVKGNRRYGGLADKLNNTIQARGIGGSPEYMRILIIHEIGHLFYAEHTSEDGCYMEHCFTSRPHWCNEERAVIEKYKNRIW